MARPFVIDTITLNRPDGSTIKGRYDIMNHAQEGYDAEVRRRLDALEAEMNDIWCALSGQGIDGDRYAQNPTSASPAPALGPAETTNLRQATTPLRKAEPGANEALPVPPVRPIELLQQASRTGQHRQTIQAEAQTHPGSSATMSASWSAATPVPLPATAASLSKPRSNFDIVRSTGFWLSMVGIVLFLFGVAFLFKYAVDKGWLTEHLRAAMGLILGTGLLGAGFIVYDSRRHLSQLLMGGSIATYYITGYAAYHLLPSLHITYGDTFLFMAATTVLALSLSVPRGGAPLALTGVIGGLATPFVLGMAQVEIPALMAYACLLLAGSAAIYLYQGWRSLLWSAGAGGLLLLYAAFIQTFWGPLDAAIENRWALQGGILFLMLSLWGAAVLREVLSARQPAKWPRPPLPLWLVPLVSPAPIYAKHAAGEEADTPQAGTIAAPRVGWDSQAHILTAGLPLPVLLLSAAIWGSLVTKETWGIVATAGAAIFALVYLGFQSMLKREMVAMQETASFSTLGFVHAITAVVLLMLSLPLLFDGNTLLLALTIEAMALHIIAYRFKVGGTDICGHLVFGIVAIWSAARLFSGDVPTPDSALVNPQAVTDLLVIALGLATSFLVSRKQLALVYRCMAHAAVMGWLWRELHVFPDGDHYVLLAWAAYALALQVMALRIGIYGEQPPEENAKAIRDETRWAGNAVFAAAGLGLLGRIALGLLTVNADRLPVLSPISLANLGVILLGAAIYLLIHNQPIARLQGLWLHVALLGWSWQEFGLIPNGGNGYVSIGWGAYGVALVLAGLYLVQSRTMLYCGLSTLFLVAGKLFFVDLHYLDEIWRILLFLGFGGLFLLLSYYFQGLNKHISWPRRLSRSAGKNL